jgi:hypothetical protein
MTVLPLFIIVFQIWPLSEFRSVGREPLPPPKPNPEREEEIKINTDAEAEAA